MKFYIMSLIITGGAEKVKKGQFLKVAACVAGGMALLMLLVFISFRYVTKYKKTDIGSSFSPDGEYEVIFQSVGEPEWPYGRSPAALVLKKGGKVVTDHRIDVLNDGGMLTDENFSASWQDDCAVVTVSGEEQDDIFYYLVFDGTVREEIPIFDEGITDGPISETEKPYGTVPDLSGSAADNEKGEPVFMLSPEEFIAGYNGEYKEDFGKLYFDSFASENWDSIEEPSPCFGCGAVLQRFTENREYLNLPSVSLYSGDGGIYEIRMTFDDHGFREVLRDQYEEMCYVLFSMACPYLSDGEISSLFDELYANAADNFWGDHHDFGDPERTAIKTVIMHGNIGFYSFYGSGNIEICMVPMTDASVRQLVSGGTLVITD